MVRPSRLHGETPGRWSVARAKKTKPQKVILDALMYYLPFADPELQAEFAGWDRLSDEALTDCEKSLE